MAQERSGQWIDSAEARAAKDLAPYLWAGLILNMMFHGGRAAGLPGVALGGLLALAIGTAVWGLIAGMIRLFRSGHSDAPDQLPDPSSPSGEPPISQTRRRQKRRRRNIRAIGILMIVTFPVCLVPALLIWGGWAFGKQLRADRR